MPDIFFDVDTALSEVPVNVFPLTDDTDFKTREEAVVYNAAGMDLQWNFVTSAGAFTQTVVTPTTAGVYDWTNQGNGMYTIEIPASGGGSINNNTEGYGWFTGVATGVLPWRGPVIGFRAAAINDSLCDTNTTGLLAPTTAGRTLDVSTGGEAGIDWANVGTPGSTVSLSATTVATVTTAATATNVTTVNGLAANVITATSIASGALTAAKFAAGAFDAVWSVATRLLTAGTNIVLAKGTGVTGFNDLSAAQVNAEADTALADYDPPTRAELTTDTNSILSKLLKYVQVLVRKDAAIATDNATEITAINADGGSGAGAFLNTTDSQEAIRDRGDAAWITATGFSTLDAAGVRSAVGLTSANLDTQLDALPTAAENADAVWDEATSGHVASGSFGQAHGIIRAGTAQAGAATTITLDASASATNDFYNNTLLVITGGTGAGQARFITDYAGATKVATVDTWITNPSSDSIFVILPFGAIPGASAPTASDVADAVWDEVLSGHLTAGSTGNALNASGSAGDPWATSLPGAYGAGTAGKIIGDNINATISSRLPTANITLASGAVTVGTNNDKSGYSISGTKTTLDALNDVSAATVNAQCDTALADYDAPTRAELTSDTNSILSKVLKYFQLLMRKDAGIATDNATEVTAINANGGSGAGTFTNTTDAVEAIRDRGDAAWVTATGFSTLDAAGVRSAVGLAAANLDTQLTAIDTNVSAVLVDTAEIGVAGAGLTEAGGDGDHLTAINLPDQTMNITGNLTGNISGSVGSVTAGVTVSTNNDKTGYSINGTKTTLDALNDVSPAQVNAEVVDVIRTDTLSELAQGVPAATPTVAQALMLLYMSLRNAGTTTATSLTVSNDAGTVICKATLSDDGTTFTKAEFVSGP